MKKGDRGPEVAELQRLLVQRGYPVSVDGDYGTRTYQAVRAFLYGFGAVILARFGLEPGYWPRRGAPVPPPPPPPPGPLPEERLPLTDPLANPPAERWEEETYPEERYPEEPR